MAEQAVLVYFNLSDMGFGTEEEREAIRELSDRIEQEVEREGVGEFDGDEFGGGQCTLFMYGPDADALFAAIEQILRESPLTRGAHVIKRYGEVLDPGAKKVRVDL